MTSIADRPRESRAAGWVRITLLALFAVFGALSTPWPWALLWLAVPSIVTCSLLLAWRFGRPALAVPAALALASGAMAASAVAPLWLTAWPALAALTGAWMGLREEGGGPGMGERAWMLVPLLALAAALPLAPGFRAGVGRFDERIRAEQELFLRSPDLASAPAAWRDAMTQAAKMPAAERRRQLMASIPSALFLWMVMLVATGRALAARLAGVLGWPPLSRPPLHQWRLPDAALVPLLAGIALLVFADKAFHPSAWTLLVHSVLGYSVQGVAVVESVLLSRGMPPVFVALTMLFVLAVSLLWVLPAVAVVGLSDVWLDYRHLDPSPAGEA